MRATAHGINYLAPHIVLLFKARHAREKDNTDFNAAIPRLTSHEKSDLLRWQKRLHRHHHWLKMPKLTDRAQH